MAAASGFPTPAQAEKLPTNSDPSACILEHFQCLMPRSCCCCLHSPSEAWDIFARSRISLSRWQKEASSLIPSPELYCRIGITAYPWTEAAPHLIGALAFGSKWRQSSKCLGKGVPLAPAPRRENSAPANGKVCEPQYSRCSCRNEAGVAKTWSALFCHCRKFALILFAQSCRCLQRLVY